MKFITLILLAVVLTAGGCGKDGDKNSSENKSESSTENQNGSGTASATEETVRINLPTVQCGTCKKNITKALKKVDGIEEFDVNIDEKYLNVKFDKTKTTQEKIEGVIVMTGYQANDKPADKEAYENLDDCCKIGGHK
ncbi:MAG: heavy-metal-associated domain-containing protein [Ignavibacteria bacterium]|nr:heavy-metal-associated domain-containing protein [Ignavibacteria bacterium]